MGSSEVAPIPFHGSDAARVYTTLVCNESMDAEAQLVGRLGEANWQKHVNVQLRMEDMRNGVEEEYMREDPCTTFLAFHGSGIGTSVPAQTQSHTSFVWSVCEREGQWRVPRESVEVGPGKSFQCYFYGKLLSSIRNRVDWKWVIFLQCNLNKCHHLRRAYT